MEKKNIAVLIGSLQATVAILLALLQLHGTLRKNEKGTTDIYLEKSLIPNVLVQELELNLPSQTSLLPLIKVAEIVQCVRRYVDVISQILQSLCPC